MGRGGNWLVVVERTTRLAKGEYPLPSEAELLSVVSRVVDVGEGCFSLYPFGRGHDKESLIVGVSGQLAFVQFMPRARSDPRDPLFAATDLPREQGYVGFNVGGTLTEIPSHRCLPIDAMIRICRHYYATLSLLAEVPWERMDSFIPED